LINTKVQRGIGVVTLSRPWVKNAVNQEMIEQLNEVLHDWQDDPEVKVLFITGEGDTFCSGGDLEEFHQLDGSQTEQILKRIKDVLYKLYTFPKPTVAALNGTAVGGGCEIAAACDFRLAPPGVTIGFIQIQLGITTGWGGANFLFSVLPRAKALELLYTGLKTDSLEAERFGFIDYILPAENFLDEALRWSSAIATHSVRALQAYKQTALEAEQGSIPLCERLSREVERSAALWGTTEHEAAVATFLKRNKKQRGRV
jgi:enoyl-CoA hydratase